MAKSALETYGHDLVEKAEKQTLDPIFGRHQEIRRLLTILCRKTKCNPILIGEPGVGKTAIVEALAQKIAAGNVPAKLSGARIVELDMGAIIAGTIWRGQLEERLKDIMTEVKGSEGKVIVFIDEIHMFVQNGGTAAEILKPALGRGNFRCIGATTLKEYKRYIEKDGALARRFKQVYVNEPSVEDSISILRVLKERYEKHHLLKIKDSALIAAAKLSHRYITGRQLPDKAIDLVDEASACMRVQLDTQPEEIDELQNENVLLLISELYFMVFRLFKKIQAKKELNDLNNQLQPLLTKHQKQKSEMEKLTKLKQKKQEILIEIEAAQKRLDLIRAADIRREKLEEVELKIGDVERRIKKHDFIVKDTVGPEEIADEVSRWTGVPVSRLTGEEKEWVMGLAGRLKRRVVGQNEAVDSVAEAVIRFRAGLARPNQPNGSFLFLGPSGVGKTELAKGLAHELFNDEKRMVRIDMSEYMEKHSVSRLIGSPPGYVGYHEGGQLTEPVKSRPYCVVLLDEVEKAHVDVLNILLQVLDDGRLTDGQGSTVDFRNTVIIMTSNLGAGHLLSGKYCSMQVARDRVIQKVKEHFKPEFVNRLDEILIFRPLSKDQQRRIAKSMMKDVARRLSEKGIAMAVTKSALDFVLDQSFDPVYGARPIRRWLEKKVVTDLSKMLIKEEIGEEYTVYVDANYNGKDLKYNVEKNNGLINGISVKRYEILIQIPTMEKNKDDQSEEDEGGNEEENVETTSDSE
ncbi:chaperone protein ClpB1 [Cucumis melo var. makuwa]|uniref:Chaperone protein ClpB1 n=1 Tax=Cucumis melo var. makuwa TaxID=1194695 RepID=A0A5A7UUZ9_CUCMM|nr:chaperone protein ClpB1 [Cucumis melo var. makuwa]